MKGGSNFGLCPKFEPPSLFFARAKRVRIDVCLFCHLLRYNLQNYPNTSQLKKFLTNKNLLILFAALYIIKVISADAGDFMAYYGAANDIRQGKTIYFVEYMGWSSYSYPPFFAMLLVPLAALPLIVADTLWLLLSVFLLFRIFRLIEGILDISTVFSDKMYKYWVILVLIFTSRFILYNFDNSQTTIVVLWGCLESLNLTLKNLYLLSGLVLATVISIKLMPLVVIPYFFYRSYYKSGFWALSFLIFLNLLPSIFYGFEGYVSVLKQWNAVINPVNNDFIFGENDIEESVHSLSALFAGLFTDRMTRHGINRHITVLSHEKIIFWHSMAQLFFISLTLFFLKTMPFKSIANKRRIFGEFSYLMLIVPIIFPHQQKYAFVMILPAVAFICLHILQKKQEGILLKNIIALMLCVWLLTTATTDGIIGKNLFECAQYFKLITWGTILLIIPLSICLNRYENNN
jgi:Glycosyltransferase family 87